MIRHGVNGLIVESANPSLIAKAIKEFFILAPGKQQEMSAHARRIAVEEYSMALQARRYAELYQAML
jgi:glycosyltransferase involved in cell wall biosynthesis